MIVDSLTHRALVDDQKERPACLCEEQSGQDIAVAMVVRDGWNSGNPLLFPRVEDDTMAEEAACLEILTAMQGKGRALEDHPFEERHQRI